MCIKYLLAAAVTAMLAFGPAAQAASIPGLVNTGAGLSAGDADGNWTISGGGASGQAIVIQDNIPGSWLDNDATSRWIWQTQSGTPTNVTRTFSTTFDLTGFDPLSASISGRWAADNNGLDILINGASTGQTAAGFTNWTAFTIDGGFQSGLNTLAFVVRDTGVISGFRAEFQSSVATPIPVPAALPLLLAGLGGLAALRRRSRA